MHKILLSFIPTALNDLIKKNHVIDREVPPMSLNMACPSSAHPSRQFALARTQLAFTASHHSAANGQSERTNQIFTYALRCALGGRYDQSTWEELLPYVQLCWDTQHVTHKHQTLLYLDSPSPPEKNRPNVPINCSHTKSKHDLPEFRSSNKTWMTSDTVFAENTWSSTTTRFRHYIYKTAENHLSYTSTEEDTYKVFEHEVDKITYYAHLIAPESASAIPSPARARASNLEAEVAPGGDLRDWAQHRADLRSEAADAVKLAQARMKLYYDKDHSPLKFGDRAYLRLSKKSERGYHLQNQTKLSFIEAGLFDIVFAYRPLALELRLPD
ncbi:hypothetical protein M430DRAFT_23396 [Amorphotheca resinae ATCC 22711]|uniref:Integrase catalytic domain-containing protein n=1 Tax=Amorphotheca resinae ATCC 22711 TaxID=857342 RepID=A0A2T3AP48_AMORE|nr:hypothetical protein M430DRAFT_23396 [Amorphotheca resinae ATCC 22711]PSS06701.1 hypothetical protein M430DRAFT_23396 [Amorphotheca resinae ATCC 22711]